ncbi:MAG: LPXTG cell wall anchor domain-containing protein [Clostridia bacterium]
MVIDGQNVQATRIVADKADVTGAVIGYLYSVLADQATVDTIVGLLGENGSMVSGILSGLLGNGEAGFTNALFELLGLPLKGEDGSSEGNENVNTGDTTVAVVAGAAVLAAGAVLLLSRKKKEN